MTLPLLCVIVFFAFTTEAAFGFGATVLTVTLGAHLYPIEVILPAFVPVNVALSAILLGRHAVHVDRKLLLARILPPMAVGLGAGLLLFRFGAPGTLRLGFAAFVIVLAALELGRLARGGSGRPLPRAAGAAILVLGGVVHGLYGSGGPMVVYYTSRADVDKAALRVTLSALWLLLNAGLLVNYLSLGLLGAGSLVMSAAFVPALAVAMLAGEWLHHRLDARTFRVAVYVLLLGAGLALLARSLGDA